MHAALLLLALVTGALSVGCLDESGNPVDWFAAVKVPRSTSNGAGTGLTYYYLDANSHSSWQLSSHSLSGTSGAIVSSVKRIYHPASGTGALVWNDEYPDGQEPSGVAHAKGMLLIDGSSGMYLIHSCPHFPPTTAYGFPDTATEYGQTFLCVSIDSSSVSTVLSSLLVTRPGIYLQTGLTSTLQRKYSPYLAAVMNGTFSTVPTAKSFSITSAAGVPFTLFGKNKEWNSFLYERLVAPTLGSDLIAETWTKGATDNITPTFCKNRTIPYNVYNAEHVKFCSDSWSRNSDHSKWAVGVHTKWWCIGGINRQVSQNLRGGGTLCTDQYPGVQQLFYAAVIDVNPCGTGKVTAQGSQPPK